MTAGVLNLLFIDNFDSFTFNLVDEFGRRGCNVSVWRNDIGADRAIRLALEMPPPRLIVLSPGPGSPSQAGCCVQLVREAAGRAPLFGVCLGHQAIVEAFGGIVGPAGEIVHGKPAAVTHGGKGLFRGLPSPMKAARYHSLAAKIVPSGLRVTAVTGNIVMAVEHEKHAIAGVQFHPESIMTPEGGRLIENATAWASKACLKGSGG
jgi:anthranilate synthase/aminodeoxychorismate synthase-like glutamine amidotransferase